MPLTIAEMVAKGKRKLTVKASVMKDNYDDAKPRMKTEYSALPFGPKTKAAYNAGVDAGVYRTPDPDKWGRGFEAGVSR